MSLRPGRTSSGVAFAKPHVEVLLVERATELLLGTLLGPRKYFGDVIRPGFLGVSGQVRPDETDDLRRTQTRPGRLDEPDWRALFYSEPVGTSLGKRAATVRGPRCDNPGHAGEFLEWLKSRVNNGAGARYIDWGDRIRLRWGP
ncbi:MAG: hypothetical protein DLM58_22555 [Pseudonocardiales bacterium]|nr:MAG: hypothetical protein DLM58_22555 [Pseudonocardiales bacterium]